jgi:uncharacterized membrane protein
MKERIAHTRRSKDTKNTQDENTKSTVRREISHLIGLQSMTLPTINTLLFSLNIDIRKTVYFQR